MSKFEHLSHNVNVEHLSHIMSKCSTSNLKCQSAKQHPVKCGCDESVIMICFVNFATICKYYVLYRRHLCYKQTCEPYVVSVVRHCRCCQL